MNPSSQGERDAASLLCVQGGGEHCHGAPGSSRTGANCAHGKGSPLLTANCVHLPLPPPSGRGNGV